MDWTRFHYVLWIFLDLDLWAFEMDFSGNPLQWPQLRTIPFDFYNSFSSILFWTSWGFELISKLFIAWGSNWYRNPIAFYTSIPKDAQSVALLSSTLEINRLLNAHHLKKRGKRNKRINSKTGRPIQLITRSAIETSLLMLIIMREHVLRNKYY